MPSVIIESPAWKPEDVRILRLFKYCKDNLKRDNIYISLPKHTDPRDTYQWQYLERFIEKMKAFQISDDFINELAYNILANSFSKNNRRVNGLSILNFDSAIDGGLSRLCKQEEYKKSTINHIVSIHSFMSNIPNCVVHLKKKPKINGLPNIVIYHMQNKISTLYLAISLTCAAAMRELPYRERRLLPSTGELFEIRFKLLNNTCLVRDVKAILKEDWRYA